MESEKQQLLQVQNLTQDETITKEIIKEGLGNLPEQDQEIYFYYIMKDINGNYLFGSDSQSYKAVLGQNQVYKYLETALATMKMGERSLFRYKKIEELEQNNENIQLEIELIKFGQYRKNNWDLNSEQREKKANELKNQGNEYIKNKDFENSRNCYKEGIRLVKDDFFEELKLSLLNNLSLAYLKTQEYQLCIEIATQSLEMQPDNVKVLYRRGVAYCQNGQFQEAHDDYTKGLQIEPGNSEIRKELDNLKIQKQKQTNKEKSLYANMFK